MFVDYHGFSRCGCQNGCEDLIAIETVETCRTLKTTPRQGPHRDFGSSWVFEVILYADKTHITR